MLQTVSPLLGTSDKPHAHVARDQSLVYSPTKASNGTHLLVDVLLVFENVWFTGKHRLAWDVVWTDIN